MGNRVSEKGIEAMLDSLNQKGVGGVHIIPIYGLKGEASIPFMSDSFVYYVKYTIASAKKRNMFVDMSLGSGWPYGGDWVKPEHRAISIVCKAKKNSWPIANRDEQIVAQYCSTDSLNWMLAPDTVNTLPYRMLIVKKPTYQMVKRASLGGKGYVVDHFSKEALQNYLSRFDSAFNNGLNQLRAIYMDSYEVFGANFTPNFMEAFKTDYGYNPINYLPFLFFASNTDTAKAFRQDYHQLIAKLLINNFGGTLRNWANGHGVGLRLQAHGSPTNLPDFYAIASIPETESFGNKSEAIRGYKPDADYPSEQFGEPDAYCIKLAGSARRILQKPLASSETGTWIAEHFCESWALLKPRFDELWLNGINHIGWHGVTYRKPNEPFPGRRFYATTHFGPCGHMYFVMNHPANYVTLMQKRFQHSKQTSRALVLHLPYDLWSRKSNVKSGLFMQEVHHANQWLHQSPSVVVAKILDSLAIDYDFLSEALLDSLFTRRLLIQPYKCIVVPDFEFIPLSVINKLSQLNIPVITSGKKTFLQPNLNGLGKLN